MRWLRVLCRRAEQLREKFCFTCTCTRCTVEASPPPAGLDSDNAVPYAPAWFLSAMAPAELPDEASFEEVTRAMGQIRSALAELVEQAQDLFVRQGRAQEAWTVLESGLLKASCLHKTQWPP